jgi:hypothetical protein
MDNLFIPTGVRIWVTGLKTVSGVTDNLRLYLGVSVVL